MAQPRVLIRGVAIDAETERSAVERVMGELDEGRGGLMVTANLDHMRRCETDPRYGELVERAELVVADGMPLVWASRVLGTSLPERVAGSNLIWSMCRAAAERGRSVFLLGGDPGAAAGARRVLEGRFPGLRVAGVLVPEHGFENDPVQMEGIERALVEAAPDVVFVALGSPKQEFLGERLLDVLPRAWFVGCGITLSFVAGRVRRAPVWMQRLGLEWLHRLVQEPRRLARRYLADGLPFAAVLLAGAARERVAGVPSRARASRAAGALPRRATASRRETARESRAPFLGERREGGRDEGAGAGSGRV